MQRYHAEIASRSETGWLVPYADAEAYAEEKARAAVQRERDEIISMISNMQNGVTVRAVSLDADYLKDRIRSRGQKEAGPPKLEHVAESEFDGDRYWAVKKLNAAIDAIESLRRDRA